MNAFTTNLRGLAAPLAFLGRPISDLVAVGTVAGSVAVAFGALSYAGTLTVSGVADPDVCDDVEGLAGEVQRQLDAYAPPPR